MKSEIELTTGQTMLFIGDSITDVDRTAAAYKPLGYGYVHFTANTILAKYPEQNLKFINTGISGNTIHDLKNRWQKDCLDHQPDILSVLIGVNDLGRQHSDPQNLTNSVYIEEFQSTYRQLLLQAKRQCDCQIILMEPFMFCDDTENQMFKDLHPYIELVRKMAEEFDTVLVPLQSRINEQINKVPSEKWSNDLVHPYLWAHAWISQQWLDATGL